MVPKPARWWVAPAARLCLVLGAISLFLGALLAVGGRQLFRADQFADRAADSLDDPRVAAFVADQAANQIIAQQPQLLGARPILVATLQGMVATAPFRALVRRAAREAHRAAFSEQGRNLVLSIPDLDVVLRGALAQGSPDLAKKIPHKLTTSLQTLVAERNMEAIVDIWRLGRRMRGWAAILLFGVAPILLVAAVWLGPDRQRTLFRLGIHVAAAGLLTAAIVPLGRLVFSGVEEPLGRGALQGVWRTYLGNLLDWGALFAGLGIMFAAAGSALVQHFDLARLATIVAQRSTRTPQSRWGRVLWGLAWIVGGIVAAIRPQDVLAGFAIVLGVGAAFVGVRELFLLVQESVPKFPAVAQLSPRGSQAATVATVVGILLALAVTWGFLRRPDRTVAAAPTNVCNGHAEICDRRLDDVVFAASHNSMSNTEITDWMFPHHQGRIRKQLDAGVRALLVDVHRGFPGAARIKTDLEGETITHERLVETLGPEGMEAAQRIRDRLVGVDEAHPALYLCHGFCELGAYEFEPVLRDIRDFLVDHPQEVLILVLEDYVTQPEIVAAFESSGLIDFVYKGPSSPWPTLGEMVETDGRVVVFTESGTPGVEWLRPTIGNIQETPYTFYNPAEFSVRPNRGGTTGSLYQLNHWIQTTPAPKLANAESVNARDVLLKRALQFRRERGHVPNLVAIDFYETGDLFAVVDSLNILAGEAASKAAALPRRTAAP